jgi:hypothetical protein
MGSRHAFIELSTPRSDSCASPFSGSPGASGSGASFGVT